MNNDACSQKQIADYKRDGFLIVKNVLPKETIESIQREIAQILCAQIHYLDTHSRLDAEHDAVYPLMRRLFAMDERRYLACLRLISRLYSLQMLMMHPHIADYMKALGLILPVMQSRTVFHVMSNQLRFPNGYFGFDVHQDWPSLQSSLDMVTVWIPLVDVDVDLFPLEVIPGSHLLGFSQGAVAEHVTKIDRDTYHETDFVKLVANRGDIVLMSAFNLHRSAVNGRDDDVRLAASCRYENALEPHVIAHAYPYCQQNIVHRELIVENFPTREQVQAVFLPASA